MAAKAKQADAERDGAPDEETEQPAAAPKKKLPLKLIIIAAAGLLVLGGGGAAGYLFLGGSNAGTDRTQYLKVKIVLELPDPSAVAQIQPLMPRVMDAFQTYLRELRPTDLDGSAGLYRLKEELTRRVNAAVSPNRITAVLFKEIVVQ